MKALAFVVAVFSLLSLAACGGKHVTVAPPGAAAPGDPGFNPAAVYAYGRGGSRHKGFSVTFSRSF